MPELLVEEVLNLKLLLVVVDILSLVKLLQPLFSIIRILLIKDQIKALFIFFILEQKSNFMLW